MIFDRFGVAFGTHFGGQNRPKSVQVRSKMALEAIFLEKSEFSRKPLKTNEKSIKMTPRAVTKRPKIVPKRCQDDLEEVFFSLRFLHRFLVVFWIDFGVILGGFWESKSVIFGIDFGHRFLIVFWSDLGVIWGGFWEALGGPNRSFLAFIFR